MFIGYGKAYRLGEILKLSYGVKLQRDLTIFIGEVDTSRGVNPNVVSPRKDFNLLMEGGLGWIKWLKNGAWKILYFMELFLLYILFCENFIG